MFIKLGKSLVNVSRIASIDKEYKALYDKACRVETSKSISVVFNLTNSSQLTKEFSYSYSINEGEFEIKSDEEIQQKAEEYIESLGLPMHSLSNIKV